MLLNCLGTFVTVAALLKMANIRVAGETRPTEQLLNDDGNTFQLEPNYTPEGGTFEPNYTPEGGPFETTEMPFEGESGFPTDGDLTSQPTVGNILDKSSFTEKPVDIEDEDLFRGPIKCCNQAVCDFAVGPDSECVEQEGYIEECEQDGDSHVGTNASPRLAAPRLRGVCMCKPGYLLEDSGKCTQRSEYNCCTDLDCELYVGVHGECGDREGGNPEACAGIIKDEIKREVRVRREVGLGEGTSTTSVYDLPQGKCICKPGYALVFGDCISTNTTEGGTTLRNGSNGFEFGTTETGTHSSGIDVSTVGNLTPISRKQTGKITGQPPNDLTAGLDITCLQTCYDFRCTGYNCTESLRSDYRYCDVEPGSQCYVSKQCEVNGLTYIFGCEDPCSNQTIPGSRDCFTVTCTPRDDACNNETSVMDMYRCTSGSGWLMSDHLSFLLVLSVVLGKTI